MRKIFAIGTLLLSSAAVLVTPAAALDRNDYGRAPQSYQTPQSYQVHGSYPLHESYQARMARLRRERLERERLERERRLREMRFHRDSRW
jgi:hypothetical protein